MPETNALTGIGGGGSGSFSNVTVLMGGVVEVYNTTPANNTNHERVKLDWSSNVARLWTQNDGTGSGRALQVGVSTLDASAAPTRFTQWTSSSLPLIQHQVLGGSTAGIFHELAATSGSISGSSGTQTAVAISPTFAQTATAAGVALDVNPSGTFGSGGGLIARFALGGTTRASIDSAGNFRQVPVAVASLTVAATAGAGARAFVNNALAPAFGSAVVAGGAVTVPVYSDGAAWIVG